MAKRTSVHDRYVELRDELAAFKEENGISAGRAKQSEVDALEPEVKKQYVALRRAYLKAFHDNKWEMGSAGRRATGRPDADLRRALSRKRK
jgi:hypothetical protein